MEIVSLIDQKLQEIEAERAGLLAAGRALGLDLKVLPAKAATKRRKSREPNASTKASNPARTFGRESAAPNTSEETLDADTKKDEAASSPEKLSTEALYSKASKDAPPDEAGSPVTDLFGQPIARPAQSEPLGVPDEPVEELSPKKEQSKQSHGPVVSENDVIGPARPDRVDFRYEDLTGEPVSFNPIADDESLRNSWPGTETERRQIIIDIVFSRPGTSITELTFYLNSTNFFVKPVLAGLTEDGTLKLEDNLYFPNRPGVKDE